MSGDRKPPGSIHDVPVDPNGATVNFSSKPSEEAPRTLLEVAAFDEGDATQMISPGPAKTTAPRPAARRQPAPQEAEPEVSDEEAGEATSNIMPPPSGKRLAPSRASSNPKRLQGPLAKFIALPPLARAGVVVGIGLTVAVGGMIALSGGQAAVKKAEAPPTAQRTAELAAQAKAAFADAKFNSAATAWQAVLDLDPANAEAKKQLVLAKSAMGGQGTLDKAQQALDAKQYGDARGVLRTVSADSALAAAARVMWTKIDHAEAEALFAQGEDQLHKNQLDATKATLDKIKSLDDTFYGKLALELDTAQDAADKAKKK